MSRELTLTEDQKAKLKPIFQQEWQEMKPIQDDASLTPDQKKAKAKEVHEKYKTQIQSVLTPEQQAKWKQIKAEKMKQHPMGDKD